MTEYSAEHSVERLLADALQPIEPPESLSGRLEKTFSAITEAAATELSEWADELSDSEREALIMRFALGMDNREIARALGRTDGATKVLLHRAIRQLEESLEEDSRE